MVFSIVINVQGSDRLNTIINNISTEAPKIMGNVMASTAEQVVTNAKIAAPVRTGYLRDHIEIASQSETETIVESEAPYSGFVEARRPFFFPAVTQAIDKAKEDLQTAWSDLLK